MLVFISSIILVTLVLWEFEKVKHRRAVRAARRKAAGFDDAGCREGRPMRRGPRGQNDCCQSLHPPVSPRRHRHEARQLSGTVTVTVTPGWRFLASSSVNVFPFWSVISVQRLPSLRSRWAILKRVSPCRTVYCYGIVRSFPARVWCI